MQVRAYLEGACSNVLGCAVEHIIHIPSHEFLAGGEEENEEAVLRPTHFIQCSVALGRKMTCQLSHCTRSQITGLSPGSQSRLFPEHLHFTLRVKQNTDTPISYLHFT